MAEVSEKLVKLINEQINAEFASAYIYLDIENFYVEKGLNGFAAWFKMQAKEEVEHAEKFIAYLHQEGKKVVLTDIKAPKNNFNTLKDPLDLQLEHEQYVTSLIYGLVAQAEADKDYRSLSFLKWYVDEQTEEEEHSRNLISAFELYGNDPASLMKLDKELSERK